MPKSWLYYLSILLPLVFALAVLDTRAVIEWLWYHEYFDAYNKLNPLSVQPQLVKFLGGWPFPVFIGTLTCYWLADGDAMGEQFLLLPIFYVPFSIIGEILVTREFNPSSLYINPMVIVLAGYCYVLPWAIFVRLLDRMRLVI